MKTIFLVFALLFVKATFAVPFEQKPVKGQLQAQYNKVSLSQKGNEIIYGYNLLKDKMTFTFKSSDKEVTAELKKNGKSEGYFKGGPKGVFFKESEKGNWVAIKVVWKAFTPWKKTIISNHPIFKGQKELKSIYPKVVVVGILEAALINAFSGESGIANTSHGTISQTCTCGSTSITVTCSTGCGVTCRAETRRSCRYNSDGTETDCEDVDVCIGLCLCA